MDCSQVIAYGHRNLLIMLRTTRDVSSGYLSRSYRRYPRQQKAIARTKATSFLSNPVRYPTLNVVVTCYGFCVQLQLTAVSPALGATPNVPLTNTTNTAAYAAVAANLVSLGIREESHATRKQYCPATHHA